MEPSLSEPSYRTLSLAQLSELSKPFDKPLKLRGFRDLLPSGHLAARMPVTVDWRRSTFDAEEPMALLQAVNSGGNPLERSVVLNWARIPIDRVAYAEVIMTPLDPAMVSQHGQLRFVFEQGHEPELLTFADPDDQKSARFEDLILSWEVWRFRDDAYTMRRGLDEANPLSMRAYVGPQRFLEDTLQNHEWRAFRLKLPGGSRGACELLKVALALGDGVARHAIASMMNEVQEAWKSSGPNGEEPDADLKARWHSLKQTFALEGRPEEAETPLGDAETTYNPLLRSCVQMMRLSILLAVQRLVEQGFSDGIKLDNLPSPTLGSREPWMREAADCDLRGIFARAPLALDFVFHNPHALPVGVLDELDKAGLLAHRNGKRDMVRYFSGENMPYGSDGLKRRQV